MPPPLAVLATLVLILTVPRRVPLWASFLAACLILPLLCGKGLTESARLWVGAATDDGTLVFAGICAGVFVLSSILTHGGHLSALCDWASALIPSRRMRAAVMPALVGLVPMPGGAVVSAPLIDRSLGDAAVSPTDKNLINYWFRHIWEVSWPLYPAVVLASGYMDAENIPDFFLAQVPLTVVLACAGYFALLLRVPSGNGVRARPPLRSIRAAIPLVVLKKVLFDRRIYSMTALAYLIQVFGDLVQETGASLATAQFLSEAGLPVWVPVLALPFLIGFATGATLTFVAVAFPIVIPRFLEDAHILPYLVLGYAGGFVGYLASPVHMCLVLSTRYFNSKLFSAYARLAIPLLAFLAAALSLFLALGGRFTL